MPTGGWAAALGAALQGGAQMYQGASHDQQQLELEKQRAADAHAMQLLQQVIAKAQVTDIPKRQAAADAEEIYKLSPEQAFDNPQFLKARATAGVPVPTKPVPTFLDSTKMGPGTITDDSKEAEAERQGISPTTGAVLPPELIATRIARQRQEQQAQFVMDIMKNPNRLVGGDDSKGGGNSAQNPDQSANPMFDPQDVRRRMAAKFAGLEGIFPSAQVPYQTQVNLAADKAGAEARAKSTVPGESEKMQSDKALTALQSIAAIKSSMEKVYPGITTNPMDGSFNGVGPAAGAWVRGKLGHIWASPLTAVDANLKRLLPQELGALVPGARGGQLVNLLSEAQGEFGQGGSPGSFMTKLLEAEKALRGSQSVAQHPMGQAPAAAPAAGGSAPVATKTDIMEFAKSKGYKPADVANELRAQGYQFVDKV